MSLDVYLCVPRPSVSVTHHAIFVQRDGGEVEITRAEWDYLRPGIEPLITIVHSNGEDPAEVYSSNITHNLNRMAAEAGIYEALWRPDESGITRASQLIKPLTDGLARLRAEQDRFEQFNASNGWGLYKHFVPFVAEYLAACIEHPEADVRVSR